MTSSYYPAYVPLPRRPEMSHFSFRPFDCPLCSILTCPGSTSLTLLSPGPSRKVLGRLCCSFRRRWSQCRVRRAKFSSPVQVCNLPPTTLSPIRTYAILSRSRSMTHSTACHAIPHSPTNVKRPCQHISNFAIGKITF